MPGTAHFLRPDGRTYVPGPPLAAGDFADVLLAGPADDPAKGGWPYLLKVSRGPDGLAPLDHERRALDRLLAAAGDTSYRRYLPALVESFTLEDGPRRRVNVFLHQTGLFTLEQVHQRHPALDGRHLAWIFKRLLAGLGFCHRGGLIHAAVLPGHVLLHAAGHGLVLVGWGHSVAAGRAVGVLPARWRDWYPPEVLAGRPASAPADLFLAARCLVYLAGGDPVAGRMPEAVPAPLRRFVQTCLLESPAMRPGDAWALHDEFDDLLRRLYGPATFHPLMMS
jgi:hypothetical protein